MGVGKESTDWKENLIIINVVCNMRLLLKFHFCTSHMMEKDIATINYEKPDFALE